MPDTTVYLKNYQPPIFQVDRVNLLIDLYDDHAIVSSELELKRCTKGDLRLCGEELELLTVELNGKKLTPQEYELNQQALILKGCPDACTLKIITRIQPQLNTQLSGLYRSNHLFCTQCEAEGFRRITYFLDRPDVLATYTTRISADKEHYPVLLSNGNLVDFGDTQDGRHWALWEDPFKKPSYLFALVAGNLACVQDRFKTNSGRLVDLRIYVEPGNEDKCQHAMESLKKSMAWDEQVYGREYDLDIYMIVAVSDFNMGAMENKGLNIFNSKFILAKPDSASDQDFADVEGVVAHEYFHNWTGNRVTCRDWFQLSLKEGLTVFRDQEFSRDMNSRDVFRIQDVKTLITSQFPEDSGAMAHPVRPESYQEINNFYTATIYNKGAEVIRMQHTLLGKEGFRKGMDLYFQRHDGQAVTIDDFVAAMEDANHRDLKQFKLWYSQAGTPKVHAKSTFDKGTLTLTLTQSSPKTPDGLQKKPFHMPIAFALFKAQGQLIPTEQQILELKDAEQDFIFTGLDEKPVVSLLRGFSAPIQLSDALEPKELLFLLQYENDGYAKWQAASRLVVSCIHQSYKNHNTNCHIPLELIAAFKQLLLDNSQDMGLTAELLMPPSFEELAQGLEHIDVDLLERLRDSYRKALGLALQEPLLQVYKSLWEVEDHSMTGLAYARRKLRNLCLWLLVKSDETAYLDLAIKQFDACQTMTDQMASLSVLVNSTNPKLRAQALDDFYKQWSKDELVVNKWFALQATCELPQTLDTVKTLMQHPLFSMTNPNKVRALISAFCLTNPRHFHAIDGSGYVFLREQLQVLDAINPQVAARLANPFTLWNRLDKPRQDLIKQQLEILAQSKLSVDLAELVEKSLH